MPETVRKHTKRRTYDFKHDRFRQGTAVRNGREITVELRSVNSRYFEYSSRIPRTCSYLDSRLKSS